MTRFKEKWVRRFWQLRVLLKKGLPDYRIGADETLPLGKAKSIRIAPMRLGEPVASFWSFWHQGDEIYAAGRSHAGVHKLSFHKSGKWYTTLNAERKELAPGKLLEGGRWRHAVQLRYLVGDDLLKSLPEKPFREADPGYGIESPPGQYVLAHLLIGVDGTTLESPLPEGFGFPRLLAMRLRSGRCAMLVGGPLDMEPDVQRDLALVRSLRIQTSTPSNFDRVGMEVFQVVTTEHGFNRVSVIPLGPENFTMSPRPPGAVGVDVEWFQT